MAAEGLPWHHMKGRIVMIFKKVATAVAALGLMTTPVIASAAQPVQVAPASEIVDSDGQQIYGASVLLQIGLVLLVATAIYFGAKAITGDDDPASP